MKEVRPPFSWTACIFDINTDKLVSHDVLKYREKLVKDLKKNCTTKEEFVDKLFRDFMWQYWCRCEYEMILYVENGRVFVQPFISKNPEENRVDVTDFPGFDWPTFAEQILTTYKATKDGKAKIDVYDQLRFRFFELADFCWEYKHKYQRNKKEI